MLLTKLYRPKTKDNLVYRQGPSEILNKAQNKKLLLVSAPAGYGKSTIVSQWIEKNKVSSVWYSLDNSDNEPTTFLNYLITGIQTIKKDFGQNALKILNSPNPVQVESVMTLVINNLLEIEEQLFIVLDDIHLIKEREIFDAINFLLTHMPPNAHLIILTRSDPPLSTSRLRSQSELIEIRIADLSFTTNEIETFFNKKLRLGLNDSDLNSLVSKTEGWIAGLQLVALSLEEIEDKSGFIESLAGSNRYIMDYLLEEVLKKQTEEVQEFLLKTSFLNQISASLCNSILKRDDSQLLLEQLERNNMFVIPLDGKRKWYRYHHLFADLLKQRFLLENNREATILQEQASLWFEDKGFYDLAIEYALAAKDYKRSMLLLGKTTENLWEQGKHAAILKHGETFPEKIVRDNPEFSLYYSWVLITTGDRKKAPILLENAEKIVKNRIQDKNSTEEEVKFYKRLSGKISLVFAYYYSHDEYLENTASYSKKALENLGKEDTLWLGWAWYFWGNEEYAKGHLINGNKGLNKALELSKENSNIYLMAVTIFTLVFHNTAQGKYKASYEQCIGFMEYVKKTGYEEITKIEWLFSGIYSLKSLIHWVWAEYDTALEDALIAFNSCKKEKHIAQSQKILALQAYSAILYLMGDKRNANKKFNEVEEIIDHPNLNPFLMDFYVGWKLFLLVDSGNIDKANKFANQYGIGIDKRISYENEQSVLSFVRLLIAEYNLKDAEHIIAQLQELVTAGKRIETLVQLKILLSIIYKLKNNEAKALEQMKVAMEIASEEYILNYFLFDLETTDGIIQELFKMTQTQKTKISISFIEKLKAAISLKKNRTRNKLDSDLTDREIETIKLLSQDLSNQEIADKLFVSLNTIKTRLKNINLKLEVDNRRKAVAKAKEIGII